MHDTFTTDVARTQVTTWSTPSGRELITHNGGDVYRIACAECNLSELAALRDAINDILAIYSDTRLKGRPVKRLPKTWKCAVCGKSRGPAARGYLVLGCNDCCRGEVGEA